jgi:hypothetical protein
MPNKRDGLIASKLLNGDKVRGWSVFRPTSGGLITIAKQDRWTAEDADAYAESLGYRLVHINPPDHFDLAQGTRIYETSVSNR